MREKERGLVERGRKRGLVEKGGGTEEERQKEQNQVAIWTNWELYQEQSLQGSVRVLTGHQLQSMAASTLWLFP